LEYNRIAVRGVYVVKNVCSLAIACAIVIVAARACSAVTFIGAAGDGKTSISYDPATGEMGIQPDGLPVGLFDIHSASGLFTASALLPSGGLEFDVNGPDRKSWAGYQSDAFSANYSLGTIAPAGLTLQFLLSDLTVTGSGGFGTPNRNVDLVYPGAMVVPAPTALDFDFGNHVRGTPIAHQFAASGSGSPIRWSDLQVTGPGYMANTPTLSREGIFHWDTAGEQFGTYHFDVTAINHGGSDTARLSVNLVPVAPLVVDSILGDQPHGQFIRHRFLTSAGESLITWGELVVDGPGPLAKPPLLHSGGIIDWDPTGSPPGLYHFSVTASNGGGSDIGLLSVNLLAPPPRPPVVENSVIAVPLNEVITHTFTATDPDTPISELSWSELAFTELKAGILPQFDAATQLFSWNTAGTPEGIYEFSVMATDSRGASDIGRLRIGLGVPIPVEEDYADGHDNGGPTIPGGEPEIPEPSTTILISNAVGLLAGCCRRRC
jgi:hypothetical protein